jgi:hypothetical protein
LYTHFPHSWHEALLIKNRALLIYSRTKRPARYKILKNVRKITAVLNVLFITFLLIYSQQDATLHSLFISGKLLCIPTVLFPCGVGRVASLLLSRLECLDLRVIYLGVP